MTYVFDPDDKFGYKDTLPENHPEKVITGVEFDEEFRKISSGMGDLHEEIENINAGGTIEEAPADGLLYGRKDRHWHEVPESGGSGAGMVISASEPADKVEGMQWLNPNTGLVLFWDGEKWLQMPGGRDGEDGEGSSDWADITGKPTEFPPEAHGHEIDDVNGLQDALDAAGGTPAWGDITDKPTDFPPSAHDHAWGEITGKPTEFPPANAVKLTGDQTAAGHKTWTGIATFGDTVILRGQINGDDTANFQNAVTAGSFVKSGGTSGEYLMADGSVSAGPEAGGSVQIGDTFDGTPSEGDQWLETPAGGEAVMWIYDGEKWLQMPGGGAGQITTASLILDHPTRSGLPPGAETQADANHFFTAALSKVVTPEGEPIGPDLNDYYTSLEADEKFQPKGDYIEDAPSDGELYVRKDGKWELYTPSSGGGGGGYMVPITPPQTAGEFQFGVKSNGGSAVFKNDMGSWYCQKSDTTATFTVPAGYKFVLQNFIANGASKDVMFNGIYLDDKQINTSSDTSNQYKKTEIMGVHDYDKRNLWPAAQNFIIERKAIFTLRVSGDNWFHIFGYFIPSDNTRESAELREAYLAEEAERIAAMPVTMDLPEEGDE